MTNNIIWLIAVILFLVLEASTPSLTSIWFAAGALVALILNIIGITSIYIQLIVFLAVSLFCVFFIRRYTKGFTKQKTSKTNYDRIIDTKIQIAETSSKPGEGIVVVNDVEWKVKTTNGETLNKDEWVNVIAVEGVKLIVEKI